MGIHRAKDSKAHLCDTCMLHPAECNTGIDKLEYGDGKGNDNITGCTAYHDSFIKLPVKPEVNYNTDGTDLAKMEAPVIKSVCDKHQWHFFREQKVRQCHICGKMESY